MVDKEEAKEHRNQSVMAVIHKFQIKELSIKLEDPHHYIETQKQNEPLFTFIRWQL